MCAISSLKSSRSLSHLLMSSCLFIGNETQYWLSIDRYSILFDTTVHRLFLDTRCQYRPNPRIMRIHSRSLLLLLNQTLHPIHQLCLMTVQFCCRLGMHLQTLWTFMFSHLCHLFQPLKAMSEA